ncbi:MAG: Gfo/Idh/MocA family protein [Pirellulales bacterium]
MQLKVGVVGLGSEWDTRHRPALLALSDRFQVEFVCDEVTLRAEAAARQLQANPIQGFRHWIAESQVDAILGLSPQWFGAAPLIAACDHGKAFYCGSVLELSSPKDQDLQNLVDKSGISFMAEFPRRYAPATTRLKELIATHLGKPQMVFCHERIKTPVNSPGNSTRIPTSIRQVVAELADWCSYVIGGIPTSVLSVEYPNHESPSELDYQMINLDFDNAGDQQTSTTAQISCGNYLKSDWPEAASFRTPAALQVCCEKGVAFIDLPSSLIWFDQAGRHMESLEHERPVGEQLLSMFHRSVTSLVRNRTCLADMNRALSILEGAQESIATGSRIML